METKQGQSDTQGHDEWSIGWSHLLLADQVLQVVRANADALASLALLETWDLMNITKLCWAWLAVKKALDGLLQPFDDIAPQHSMLEVIQQYNSMCIPALQKALAQLEQLLLTPVPAHVQQIEENLDNRHQEEHEDDDMYDLYEDLSSMLAAIQALCRHTVPGAVSTEVAASAAANGGTIANQQQAAAAAAADDDKEYLEELSDEDTRALSDFLAAADDPNHPDMISARALLAALLEDQQQTAEVLLKVLDAVRAGIMQQLPEEAAHRTDSGYADQVAAAAAEGSSDALWESRDGLGFEAPDAYDMHLAAPASAGMKPAGASAEGSAAVAPRHAAGETDVKKPVPGDQPLPDTNPQVVRQLVMFATNRERITKRKPGQPVGVRFANKEAQPAEMTYGEAVVTLPLARAVGETHVPHALPKWMIPKKDWLYLYHIDLRSSNVKATPKEAWLESVVEAVQNSNGELLLYIHGFNNSFKSVMETAAQLVVDTARCTAKSVDSKVTDTAAGSGKQTEPWGARAAIAFDWASCASVFNYDRGSWIKGYRADLKMGENSAPMLAQLLRNLSSNLPDGTKVHILCHSMGNHVLCQALQYVFPSTEDAPGEATYEAAKRLFDLTSSIIFAAADINRSETNGMQHMLNLLHRAIGKRSSCSGSNHVSTSKDTSASKDSNPPAGGTSTRDVSLVLYCSKNDKALAISSGIFKRRGDCFGRAGYYSEFFGGHGYHPFMEPLKHNNRPVPHPLKTVDASGHHKDIARHGYFRDDMTVLAHIAKVMDGDDTLWEYELPGSKLNCSSCWKVYKQELGKLFLLC